MTPEDRADHATRAAALEKHLNDNERVTIDLARVDDVAAGLAAACALLNRLTATYEGLQQFVEIAMEVHLGQVAKELAVAAGAPKIIVTAASNAVDEAYAKLSKAGDINMIDADDRRRVVATFAALSRVAATPLPGE